MTAHRNLFLRAATLALLAIPTGAQPLAKGDYVAYIGTYNRQKSKGIYAYRFQPKTGKFTAMGLVAEATGPAFLAIHPNQHFLYAVNEISDYEGKSAGSVSSFSIDLKTGQLKFLNKVSSGGSGPCHLAVDNTGKCVLVANYNSGSVAAFPLKDDGTLAPASAFVQHAGSSVNPQRQSGPHAHATNLAPDNRFVLVTDLGLDQVIVYRLDPAKGALSANDPPFVKVAPGSGPRHLAFHPKGQFVYLLSEMVGTVTAFRYDAERGYLQQLQTITTLAKGYTGKNGSAEIAVHPDGKFLYASNRGPDDIAIFSIDPAKGTLTAVGRVSTQGIAPRNFAIDPTGAYLIAANQDSDNLAIFRIDRKTGKLTPTGDILETGAPVCVAFLKVP